MLQAVDPAVLPGMLQVWGFAPEALQIAALHIGNINDTFIVTDSHKRWVLQRLNPVFTANIHHNIEAVTERLEEVSIVTPRLLRTKAAKLWHEDSDGGVWRVMNFIDGVNHSEAGSDELCASAGHFLGRFHSAIDSLPHTFEGNRAAVHDTPRHVGVLKTALGQHEGHEAYADIAPVAEGILAALDGLRRLTDLPERIVHGDPKLNNFMFDSERRAFCLIDLDTVGPMAIPLELGDAFRSWCNPGGEDSVDTTFELSRFRAGLTGYGESAGALLRADERDAVAEAVLLIAWELAARFCADALNQKYFAWNQDRYDAAWQHHLVRARSQASLARSIDAQLSEMQSLVSTAFRSRS